MSEEPQEYEAQESLPYIPSASFQQDTPVAPLAQTAEQNARIPAGPASPGVADSSRIQKKSRRGLWITISLIILLLVSVSAFFTIQYINRSTPSKTLDTFCSALQRQNYQTAYSQFSQTLQKTFSESVFASSFSQSPVTACTYTTIKSNGDSVTTSIKIVHGYAGTNDDVLTLSTNSDQEWKIDDFYRL